MSRAKLAWTQPWREKVGAGPIRLDLIYRTSLYNDSFDALTYVGDLFGTKADLAQCHCASRQSEVIADVVQCTHQQGIAASMNLVTEFDENRHSGYFPWNHGKFICKGEGKWSCPGLRPYRSYGSEVMGWPYEQARRPPYRFRPTPLVASLPMTKIAIA